MRVYIASHCQQLAREAAEALVASGHEINCRWINSSLKPTADYSIQEREAAAIIDFEDVLTSQALVLLSGPEKYPGGKHVEAGIALGVGLDVVVVGPPENLLYWHPRIKKVATIVEAAAWLRQCDEQRRS